MEITPDFSEAIIFESIPDGTYKARIASVESKKSKKDEPMLKWKFTLFGGEGDLSKFNNAAVFYNTMIGGKGAGMLKTLWEAVLGEVPAKFDTDQLLGGEVSIVIKTGYDQHGQKSKYPDVKAITALQPPF